MTGGSPPRTEIPGKVSSPPRVFFSALFFVLTGICQLQPPPPPLPTAVFGDHDLAISLLFIYGEFSLLYFFFSALYSGPPPSGVFR